MKTDLRSIRGFTKQRQSGYVLVVTVMLLAVTVLIVAGIARHSLFKATSAKLAKSQLQEKWAVASSQRFCLSNGNAILKAIDQPKFRFSIQLSDLVIINQISDESAKLDINSLAADVSGAELTRVVKEISNTGQLIVRLRPTAVSSSDATRRPYEAWGQVFVARQPDSFADLRRVAGKVTCWGNKLNFRNADNDVLRRAIKAVAGSIMAERLLSELAENPTNSLNQVLVSIDATERQSERLSRLLSDKSWGTSVWTDVISPDKAASYFAVQARPIDNIFRYQTFQWQ